VSAVLAELEQEREAITRDPTVAYAMIERGIEQYIDFPIVARLALGKHWRQATPEQQATFTQEFRTMLVRFYGKALMSFIAERGLPGPEAFRVLPERGEPGAKYATIRSQILRPDAAPVPVDYSLRRVDDDWKIYDVAVEGISVVTSYRSNFSQEIATRGLDAVIDGLAERNRQAAADIAVMN
jgi:phospholipid transport system substrate-binding protein